MPCKPGICGANAALRNRRKPVAAKRENEIFRIGLILVMDRIINDHLVKISEDVEDISRKPDYKS